jgi:hypothetical protein
VKARVLEIAAMGTAGERDSFPTKYDHVCHQKFDLFVEAIKPT